LLQIGENIMRKLLTISAAAVLTLGIPACNKPAEEAAEPAAEAEPAVAEPATSEPAAPADNAAKAPDAAPAMAPATKDAVAAPAAEEKKEAKDQLSSGGVIP
jgi:hypothetical protein